MDPKTTAQNSAMKKSYGEPAFRGKIIELMKKRKLSYLGHILRGSKYKLPKEVLIGKLEGKDDQATNTIRVYHPRHFWAD